MIKKSDQPVVKSRNENDSPWYSICFKVLTKPSAKTFEELLSSKYATKSIAYVLIFVGSLMIASSTIFIKGIPLLSDNSSELPDYLFNIPFFFLWVQVFTFFILCGVAGIMVIVQLPVRIMKRKGKFDHFMFALSAFYAPVGIFTAFLSIVLHPISSNLFTIALALIVFYAIVLSIFAIKAVYQMRLGQAIVSVLVTVIVTILWGAYYVQSFGKLFYYTP